MKARYQTRTKLSEDEVSISFDAWDEMLSRPVILRSIKTRTNETKSVETFRRKHRLLASFHHPASLEIYNVDDTDGVFSVVTEPVRGTNLEDVCKEGLIGEADFEKLVEQTLSWAMAWEASTDRDLAIRPRDILVIWDSAEDFRFKVCDFDLAEEAEFVRGLDTSNPAKDISPSTLIRSLAKIYWFSLMGEVAELENEASSPESRTSRLKNGIYTLRPDVSEERVNWLVWLIEQTDSDRRLTAREAFTSFCGEGTESPKLKVSGHHFRAVAVFGQRDPAKAEVIGDDEQTAPVPLELLQASEEASEIKNLTSDETAPVPIPDKLPRKITSIPLPVLKGPKKTAKKWRIIESPESD